MIVPAETIQARDMVQPEGPTQKGGAHRILTKTPWPNESGPPSPLSDQAPTLGSILGLLSPALARTCQVNLGN